MLLWVGLLPSIRAIIARPIEAQRLSGVQPQLETAVGSADANGDSSLLEVSPTAGLPSPRGDALQVKLDGLVERDERQFALIMKQWLEKA